MKIGVYVGSFDPVHKGHKQVMNWLVDNKYVDKVMMIPTGGYWDKSDLVALDKRIAMCKYYENDKIEIIDRYNELPYTYMILDKLKEENPDNELYLIIGADNIKSFHLWKEVDKILNDNYVIVIPRDDVDTDKYIDKFYQKEKFIKGIGFKEIEVSSSEIRRMLKNSEDELIIKYIDREILDYIRDNELYL